MPASADETVWTGDRLPGRERRYRMPPSLFEPRPTILRTMPAPADTDVLIAGAGPVGLFLANECARRGLKWRLVEARAAQSQHSKALAIFPRTLEIFDMAAIAAPLLDKANRAPRVPAITRRRRLPRLRPERGAPR